MAWQNLTQDIPTQILNAHMLLLKKPILVN
jgi:hypothetical protein